MDFSSTIITLTKNDIEGFVRTLKSLTSQKYSFNLEWVILDGSKIETFSENKIKLAKFSAKNNFLKIKHINMSEKDIFGIYQCMNYGLKISSGDSILFLNGGDTFFCPNSLNKLFKSNNNLKHNKVISFGQAKIISKVGISWNFPGKNISNIEVWLRYFEPNHQSMMVSSDIAKDTPFKEECLISGDKFWKREVLYKAAKFNYLDFPVCKFYLEGFSSIRPNKKILISQIRDKHISFLRKAIILIKFLTIPKVYKYYPYFQKLKSKIIDFIL